MGATGSTHWETKAELYQEAKNKTFVILSCPTALGMAWLLCLLWVERGDCVSCLPQVVPATEDEVGFRIEGGAHLPQAAVAAGTFETVLMPVFVQGLEQVAVFNLAIAASTPLLFPFGLDGEHRHTCSDKETNSHAWFTAWEHEWLFMFSFLISWLLLEASKPGLARGHSTLPTCFICIKENILPCR